MFVVVELLLDGEINTISVGKFSKKIVAKYKNKDEAVRGIELNYRIVLIVVVELLPPRRKDQKMLRRSRFGKFKER